eukprot:454156_1
MLTFFFATLLANARSDDPWPTYGANNQNQQFSNSELNTCVFKQNSIESECVYTSPNSIAFFGFIVVDEDNNGYLGDVSGDIFKFNLDTCEEIWRTSIASLLDHDNPVISRNAVTLYDDIVLFGTPNARQYEPTPEEQYPLDDPCYAVALNKNDGSLVYKIDLTSFDLNNDGKDDYTDLQSFACHVHGFVVDQDSKYAYGGMSSVANFMPWPNAPHAFSGRVYKINLETQSIENVFFTFPNNMGQTDDRYTGASTWNFPSLIDDYLVFGSGNLYSYPDRIGDCLMYSGSDTSLIPANNYAYNMCGEDKSDNPFWRCLEDNVFSTSLITLNTKDFSLQSVVRTNGIDAWTVDCLFPPEARVDCPIVPGTDLDVTGIATYKNSDGDLIAVSTTKGLGFLGNAVWGSAVDPQNEIAISTNTGAVPGKYTLPNGDIICATGTAQAIDLKTGKTKWIFVVPYGRIVSLDPNACPDEIYGQFEDVNMNVGRCTIDPFGNNNIDDSDAVIIIPPMSDKLPIDYKNRAQIIGVVTISNGLVYIPTITGDVYVLKLIDGEFITRFECPAIEKDGVYNRAGIHSGVTVVEERVIFYCGSNKLEFGGEPEVSDQGNLIKSIIFETDECDNEDNSDDN